MVSGFLAMIFLQPSSNLIMTDAFENCVTKMVGILRPVGLKMRRGRSGQPIASKALSAEEALSGQGSPQKIASLC